MLVKKRLRKNKTKSSGSGPGPVPVQRFSGMLSLLFGTLGIVCLSLLLILGHDIMTQGDMFAAKQIVVLGNHQLSEARVLSLSGVEPGVNIFAVNLSLARKRLLSDGWIAEARVGREIPDRLVIRVREHVPIAILDLGRKYIMSREGTIINEFSETDSPGLPLVTGLYYSDLPLDGDSPREPFVSLLQVLMIAQKDKGPLSLSRLERIDVDRDLGITLHADGPVETARIGFQRFAEKYARIDRLLGYLDRGPSDQALEIIEIESDGRIVAGPFPEAIEDKTIRRS